jgi:Tfp pilus assembly protein PilP
MKKAFLNNLVYVIIFISIFSAGCKGVVNQVFRVLGEEVGEKVSEKIIGASTKKPPESDWKRYQLGSSDLYLDCPGALAPTNVSLPYEARMMYDKFESYGYSRSGDFEMAAAAGVAKGIYKTDLNASYQGAVTNASQTPGVSEFKAEKSSTIISGREALLMTGTLKYYGTPGTAKGLIIVEGQKIWIVFIVYKTNDVHELIAKRIIDSVKIGAISASAEEGAGGDEIKGEDKYVYNRASKRDPFRSLILGKKEEIKKEEERKKIEEARESERFKKELEKIPLTPLQQFELASLKVVAIIWGEVGKYALLEAPDGKGYTIKKGTYVGKSRGVVKNLTADTIIVEEKYQDVDKKIKTRTIELKLKKEE